MIRILSMLKLSGLFFSRLLLINIAMKNKILLLFPILLWGIFVQPCQAVIHPSTPEPTIDFSQQTFSYSDLATLNIRELGRKRGKKLNFKERIAFLLLKRELKKAKKKGLSKIEISNKVNERKKEREGLGIVLGIFLGLIGVLIAYLAFKDAVKGAWTGLLIRIGITLLVFYYTFGQ